MQAATTKAEEDDTPQAGGIVPLTHTFSSRGFADWWSCEDDPYACRQGVEGTLVAALEVQRPVVLRGNGSLRVYGKRA